MFEKSRRRIVVAIMFVLVLLCAGTLGVVYTSSYFEMLEQNKEMLEERVRTYRFPQDSEEPKKKQEKEGDSGNRPELSEGQMSTIYMVAISHEGEILEIKNDSPALHSNEELVEEAQKIIKSKKKYGADLNLAFYKEDKGDYILVAFKDNSVINEGAAMLIRNTMIFGCITLVLFFFMSVFLAKKIVEPLEESYQKQKRFISDAGHELKTPVAVVSANAELLARELGDNQWLQNIQYENERMNTLVCQMLDLARTENVTPLMEDIDFSHLLAGEILPFESVAFEKGYVLNSSIAKGIRVEGNSTQLKQLVSILLDNAIRHSKEEGKIQMTLTKEYGFAQLSVINKGKEIPLEQRKQIFERFYRMDTVRNSEDRHYGLGLAIAKAITTSHKGHIEVQCYDGLVEFKVKIPII